MLSARPISLYPLPPSTHSFKSTSSLSISTNYISAIPPEILAEIFYNCTLICPDAPLVLTKVSRSFRHTALTHPRTWTRLRLSPRVKDVLRKAQLWLKLSGVCRLEICVDLVGNKEILVDGHGETFDGTETTGLDKDAGGAKKHVGLDAHGPTSPAEIEGSREAGHMALNRLLRSHATRIKSLAVRTSSDLEAQAFLSSIYDRRDEVPEHSGPPPRCAGEGAPCTPTSLGEDACCRCSGLRYPLQRLTISVSSSHHNPNTSSAAISPPLPLAPGLQPSFPSPTTAHFDHHRFHSCPHPSYALPSLTTVKISSPSTLTPFPFFPWHNLATVRDLSVSRPFTAPPLSAKVVEQLLKATSRLRRFELDSRVDDSPLPTLELGDGHEGSPLLSSGSAGSPHPSGTGAVSAPSHHSSTSQLATPQGVGHLVVNHDALLASNNHDSDSIHQTTSDIHSRHSLTTLPYLTHLNLRSNDIPLLLDNLVLPRLQHLAINDLDGKRRGGAMESVKVLRRVLVRMDLPMENGDEVKADEENPRTGVDGLVELKLDGVVICGSTPKSGNVVGGGEASFEHRLGEHSHGSGIVDEDEIGMWGWCLKRMRALKKLSVQRVGREDAEALLEMLMESVARKDLPALGLGSSLSLSASSTVSSASAGVEIENAFEDGDEDDLPCPELEELAISHYSASPSVSSSWSSTSTESASSTLLHKFATIRPGVKVTIEEIHDQQVFPSLDLGAQEVSQQASAEAEADAGPDRAGVSPDENTENNNGENGASASSDVPQSSVQFAPLPEAPSESRPPLNFGMLGGFGFGFGSRFDLMRRLKM